MTASIIYVSAPVQELHFSMQLKRSLMIILGFRPLSGTTFLSPSSMDLDRIARGKFPSPVGELISQYIYSS